VGLLTYSLTDIHDLEAAPKNGDVTLYGQNPEASRLWHNTREDTLFAYLHRNR
jgi:hypothetical protein